MKTFTLAHKIKLLWDEVSELIGMEEDILRRIKVLEDEVQKLQQNAVDSRIGQAGN